MSFDFIGIYYDLAINVYHVDPRIFVFLMIFSVPFYYWGWYALIKEVFDFRKKYKDKENKLKVVDIFKEKKFLSPLIVNRTAWVLPYVYVIFWGENLPTWFWAVFIGWIVLSLCLFWEKLRNNINSNA